MMCFVALLMTGVAQEGQERDCRPRVYSYDGYTWAPYSSRTYPRSYYYGYAQPRSFYYYSYPSYGSYSYYSYPSYGGSYSYGSYGVYGVPRYAYPHARSYGYAPSYRAYPGARSGVHRLGPAHRGHGWRR